MTSSRMTLDEILTDLQEDNERDNDLFVNTGKSDLLWICIDTLQIYVSYQVAFPLA